MCKVVPEMRDQNGTSRKFSSFLWHYLCTESGQALPQMALWSPGAGFGFEHGPRWGGDVQASWTSPSEWDGGADLPRVAVNVTVRRRNATKDTGRLLWCRTSRVDSERRRCSGWWANVLPFLSHHPLRTSVPNSERGLGNNRPHVVLQYTSDICLSVWAHWVSDLRLIRENISSPRAKCNSEKSNWVNRVE